MIKLEDIDIAKILPQSTPFILVDRIIDYKPGKSLTAVKNVTDGEWYLRNRFTPQSVPQSIVLEMAAQVGLMLHQLSMIGYGEKIPVYFLGKLDVEFGLESSVGDQLRIEASAEKMMTSGGFSTIAVRKNNKDICLKTKIYYKVVRE